MITRSTVTYPYLRIRRLLAECVLNRLLQAPHRNELSVARGLHAGDALRTDRAQRVAGRRTPTNTNLIHRFIYHLSSEYKLSFNLII